MFKGECTCINYFTILYICCGKHWQVTPVPHSNHHVQQLMLLCVTLGCRQQFSKSRPTEINDPKLVMFFYFYGSTLSKNQLITEVVEI